MKWELKSLDEIGFIGRGKSRHRPRNAEHLYGGDYPFVQTGDVKAANFKINEYTQTYNEVGLAQSKLWKEGTLCITIAANIADTAILGIDACFPDSIIGFVPYEDKSDVRFVKYFFDIFQTRMKSIAVGAAQDNLSLEKLLTFKIPTPPLTTQRRIASILSAYDDLIENNLKRIKLLEEKAYLRYKQIVKSESDKKRLALNDIAPITSSKRIFLSDYMENGIPFYRSKEIISKSNFNSIENPLYISEEKYADIKERFGVPLSGDLLITSVGTIGYTHLVNDSDGAFYFKDGNLIWIRNLLQKKLHYYLFFMFRTPEFKEVLNSLAIGSSQKALTIEILKKIEVEIPKEQVLIDFNSNCQPILELIYNLQKQNVKLREARDILLPRLMSGEIEV